jgi:ParB family chromosome partitioning protein
VTPETASRELPLAQLVESPTNPRRVLAQSALDDLVASVRQHGILTPLIVRPVNGHFEIIAGHRRRRAALAAGLESVPVIVREADDAVALEVATVENLQRADVHPLDEAEGYRALMALDPAYTPEAIAARVGKSPIYVHQRLKLADLVPAVKEAFLEERITAAHATLIARLPLELQPKALEACFETLFFAADANDRNALISIPRFKYWIQEHTKIDVHDPEVQQAFPELAEQVQAAEAEAELPLLEISTAYGTWDVPTGVLPRSKYCLVSGRACKSARPALVVHGETNRLQIVQVCIDKKCRTHFPPPPPKPKPISQEDRKAAEEQQRQAHERWQRLKPHALKAVAVAAKTRPFGPEEIEELLDQAYGGVDDVRAAVGVISAKNIGQAIAVAEAAACDYSREAFGNFLKARRYAVDLDALEHQLNLDTIAEKLEAPAPGRSTKKTSKKAAPKSASKKAAKPAAKKR